MAAKKKKKKNVTFCHFHVLSHPSNSSAVSVVSPRTWALIWSDIWVTNCSSSAEKPLYKVSLLWAKIVGCNWTQGCVNWLQTLVTSGLSSLKVQPLMCLVKGQGMGWLALLASCPFLSLKKGLPRVLSQLDHTISGTCVPKLYFYTPTSTGDVFVCALPVCVCCNDVQIYSPTSLQAQSWTHSAIWGLSVLWSGLSQCMCVTSMDGKNHKRGGCISLQQGQVAVLCSVVLKSWFSFIVKGPLNVSTEREWMKELGSIPSPPIFHIFLFARGRFVFIFFYLFVNFP